MAYTDMWKIIDDYGTVHSGTEEEMREAWTVMTGNVAELSGLKSRRKEFENKWMCDWAGDIKLIQIHDISN